MIRLAATLALVVLLAGCASVSGFRDTSVPIASVAQFDAERFTGRWYEVARFPVPFQTGCVGVTADYTLRADGTIAVLNTCRQDSLDGGVKTISGTAEVAGPGRLEVSFPSVPFVTAPYWVLWVDEGYRTAVVGVPSGRAGWILNRDPQIPADRLEAARQILDFNGYDVSRLEMTPQPGG